MSLTSYRAAPPREGMVCRHVKIGDVRVFVLVYALFVSTPDLEDLATTYSPTP